MENGPNIAHGKDKIPIIIALFVPMNSVKFLNEKQAKTTPIKRMQMLSFLL